MLSLAKAQLSVFLELGTETIFKTSAECNKIFSFQLKLSKQIVTVLQKPNIAIVSGVFQIYLKQTRSDSLPLPLF